MPLKAKFSVINANELLRNINYKIRHAALLTSISDANQQMGDYLHSNFHIAHYSLGWLNSSAVLSILKDDPWIISGIRKLKKIECRVPSGTFLLKLGQLNKMSYLDLYKSTFPKRIIHMDFLTPTSFRQKGRQVILPDPRLIFLSLLSRWNAFSPIRFTFPEEFYRDILWDKFSFKTSIMDMGRYRIKGFFGGGTFRLWENIPKEYCRMLVCLSRFAELSGVGYKTTMGFGMVRGEA